MVRVTEYRLEPPENGRGLFNYLWDQQCDLLAQDVLPTFQRNRIVDLTTYWYYGDLVFLIPVPDETANINSVVKPFQWKVWLAIGVSIVCVIAVLNLIQHLEYRSAFITDFRPNNKPLPKNYTNDDQLRPELVNGKKLQFKKWQTGKQYLYVFGNLLSQGGFCPSKWLPFRLVAGVWTLAAFFFVQSYTSTLFTYVVTPINPPLINSVNDIVDSGDINLLVRETGFLNTLLLATNHTGLFLALQKKLDSFPKSRCVSPSECTKLMTPGSRNVFVDAKAFVMDEIRKDFKKKGQCNFQLAKESFISTMASFALAKNSPYTQKISQGILELLQIGLIDHWDTWFRPMPPQCNGKPQSGGSKKKKLSPLSLKNLTSAFIVLFVGLIFSFLTFLGEKIISIRK
ncbi:ionotropic receptor 93a-like isoform X2 [Daphnia pulex]|nr:ionotropic receptor 93a-like isoform X2 [Daphnia pulex]XP_046448047.1 ionotropic receptor 93a-like isoform X2 [Daphnia pulex]XP_046448048.1 ionotropic receptor 93a-like isoform X2 [Daphnia pulex]XP_046448049.1 ionotropic receptor 93a-like isoform X2 [Daphnia pulex]XP_046448050.1 ionotropic receptor 93a-like isoform X2 [Daphnia pulex]